MKEPTKPTLLSDFILVRFEEKEQLKSAIIIPERYLIQEGDETEASVYGVTTDRRLINPQVCYVIQGNANIPSDVRVFVHYGAYEVAQWLDDEQALIRSSMVFFTLDPITPLPGYYLCEEIKIEGEKTESGIYTTPIVEATLPINVRITHAYNDSYFKVGDEVLTVDSAQYQLKYDGANYIKLKESEIIGKKEGDEIIPFGKYLLVEYIEEPDKELEQKNDYLAHMKDVAIKYRLHVPDVDFTPVKASKQVTARLIYYGNDIKRISLPHNGSFLGENKIYLQNGSTLINAEIGDKLLVDRNRGAIMQDGKWIINLDTILCVIEDHQNAS